MKLKWYGHAAFRIMSDSGFTMITDPYTPELIGYHPIEDTADLVVISSDNDEGHCRADLIDGSPTVINAMDIVNGGGSAEVSGVRVDAMGAMEIEDHPLHEPDQNGMFRFVVDGISIAHMGDVGNPLSDTQTDFFRDVDILLALTGALFTIELDELKRVIDVAKPRYVVPMHFRTLTYRPRNTHWINAFLDYYEESEIDFAFGPEVTLEKADLPEPTRVLVLDYER